MFDLNNQSYIMKKKYLIIVMLFSIFVVNAQNYNSENGKKNEVKLNVLLPLTGAFEATYERNLNKKNSLGVSVFTVFNNEKSHDDLNYSISPYYRRYFGKKFNGEIWEFRTKFKGNQHRLFAFWDKTKSQETLVISTHGIIKKVSKVPKSEIEKAEKIRNEHRL